MEVVIRELGYKCNDFVIHNNIHYFSNWDTELFVLDKKGDKHLLIREREFIRYFDIYNDYIYLYTYQEGWKIYDLEGKFLRNFKLDKIRSQNIRVCSQIVFNGLFYILTSDNILTGYNESDDPKQVINLPPETQSVYKPLKKLFPINDDWLCVLSHEIHILDKSGKFIFHCQHHDVDSERICWVTTYNNFFYLGTNFGDIIIRSHDLKSQIGILKGHTKYIIHVLTHNDLLYSISNDQTIRIWNKQNECIRIINIDKLYSYGYIIYNNNNIYYRTSDNISVIGEYFPNHYDNLPEHQKQKIQNWHQLKSPIHKDIKLIFERELLL